MTGGGPNGATMSLGLTNYYYAFKYGAMNKSLALGVITFLILSSLTVVYFVLDKKINNESNEKDAEMKKALGIDDRYYVVGVFTLGYADEEPEARPRKELSELVSYD